MPLGRRASIRFEPYDLMLRQYLGATWGRGCLSEELELGIGVPGPWRHLSGAWRSSDRISPRDDYNSLMARARTRPIRASENADWVINQSFDQCRTADTSVGENAVAVLNAKAK
jgi:hypothetical protein